MMNEVKNDIDKLMLKGEAGQSLERKDFSRIERLCMEKPRGIEEIDLGK